MDDERANFIAAMYKKEPTSHLTPRVDAPIGKSRKIRVGIIEYEVPTVTYVETLERLVAMQGSELLQQKRLLKQLLSDRKND